MNYMCTETIIFIFLLLITAARVVYSRAIYGPCRICLYFQPTTTILCSRGVHVRTHTPISRYYNIIMFANCSCGKARV